MRRRPQTTEEMIEDIKRTADRMLAEGMSRPDVKLLKTALRELRHCFQFFSALKGKRKVTVFGSARTPPEDPSYKQAVEFGRKMAEAGYLVTTGAAFGIMEAGHVGAGAESSVGINILLPFEQSANPVIANDPKLMHLKYFFTRKLLFVKESDAVALFPGGFGTHDEAFEALTLMQTGKSHLFPVVCVDQPGDCYWKDWRVFIESHLLKRKLICPADMSLFKVTDSVDEAVAEIQQFFRVYHSMRYVKQQLVLRLQRTLSDATMKKLDQFSDIKVSGEFELSEALPAESNDSHVSHLPRLRFHFDRKSHGRLRQLVDVINQD
ncbi:MAG: TIGR00730 family Rossman fold protein [Gemmataceae bacterium]|nr:TIGR00730 family Rossman fold protein [Gemmataceae bacterium]